MKNDVIVSVIMCVHNTSECFLIEAVKSIIDQTLTQFELIIVDDASDYDLYRNDVFNDPRIKIFKEEKNGGPAHSRNIALRISRGKYIAVMDSDDVSFPSRLEKQCRFLDDHPDYVACGTWFRFTGNKKHNVKRIIDDTNYYKCSLIFGNDPAILNPSIMIRKDTLISNNISYDEELIYGEDYKMWVQLLEYGKITNLKEILLLYRVHNNQLTRDKNKRLRYERDNELVKEFILNKIHLDLTQTEKKAFFANRGLKHVNPIEYRKILNAIVKSNELYHYFDKNSLKQRVEDQWKKIIYSTNNILKWIQIIFKLKKYRKEAVKIKFGQIKKKIKIKAKN